MRRLFIILALSLLLPAGIATAKPSCEKKQGQNSEQSSTKKDDKEDKKKDKDKGKGEEPILIVVYEYAWPPKMR